MDKLITRKEAASILGISVKTLDAARTDGLISYVQYVEKRIHPKRFAQEAESPRNGARL